MNNTPRQLSIDLGDGGAYLDAQSEGLDTFIFIGDAEEEAGIALTWTEAQQLYRWLKARLSE